MTFKKKWPDIPDWNTNPPPAIVQTIASLVRVDIVRATEIELTNKYLVEHAGVGTAARMFLYGCLEENVDLQSMFSINMTTPTTIEITRLAGLALKLYYDGLLEGTFASISGETPPYEGYWTLHPFGYYWLTGWDYRKRFRVTGTAGGAQTDYSIKLTVNRSSGTDSGATVYLDTKCNADFSDLRFTSSDGQTELDYWIESISGTVCTVWVELDATPANGIVTDFYIYYGKADAEDQSDGDTTFITFDDFERGNDGDSVGGAWTIEEGGSTACIISTEQKYSGTRSCKLVGPAAGSASMSIPREAGTDYAIQYQLYKETAVLEIFIVRHGNGTRVLNIQADVNENLLYHDGAWKDTGVDTTPDAWRRHELCEIDHANNKFDWYHAGVIIANNVGMTLSATYVNKVQIINHSGAVGRDCYVDNFIIRKYCSPEPSITSWGSEEEEA